MNMLAVKEWTVLSVIKSRIESNSVSMLYVFGSSGKEVIFVTNDDNVYAFGQNINGVLGLGHKNAVKEPTIVEMLCGKGIKLIQSNNYDRCNYVLALTKSGEIYSWGSNQYGYLGIDGLTERYAPNLIYKLRDVIVIDIGCGCSHCLALSDSGDVYGWDGRDRRVENGNKKEPKKVMALSCVKITLIACGGWHSMAVTESGVVYVWGFNGYGQLGIGNTLDQYIPIKVELTVKIAKVCGGFHHTLLLSSTGDVYAVGSNSYGQIGNGSRDDTSTPVKIAFQSKIADILASNSYNISLALSVDNKCFVWGVKGWTVPTEVMHNNMNAALNFCLGIKVTINPLTFTQEIETNVNRSLIALNISGETTSVLYMRFCDSFDVKKYSDIEFLIEGKRIFAQKFYMKSVCKQFDDIFDIYCPESCNYMIEVTGYSYSVFYSFLKYLYTYKLDIKAEEVVSLLELAIFWCEEELKRECIAIIKLNVSVENVCQIYSESLKLNCEQLAEYCADFASNKLKQICKTEDYKRMDGESIKQLTLKIYK